jgi:hypothetical protein
LLAFAVAIVAGKRGLMHMMTKKKIAALPEADKAFLNQVKTANPEVTQSSIALKVEEELKKQRIIFEKVTTVNDEIHVSWATY